MTLSVIKIHLTIAPKVQSFWVLHNTQIPWFLFYTAFFRKVFILQFCHLPEFFFCRISVLERRENDWSEFRSLKPGIKTIKK